MKKKISRCILLILANILPFCLESLLYGAGLAITLLLPLFQYIINVLNYRWTNGILSYVCLNILMLVSSVVNIEISIWLYYNNISADTGTLAVGNFAQMVAVGWIGIITLICVLVRIASKIKQRCQSLQQ
ncbi:MAG: hypothetical protein IJO61_04000 [Oscillospiraceae bacterium]|nr:hypothetical protein [Oscillospiraceae bacterium]